jgi:(S)-mandelate dehydrogenase
MGALDDCYSIADLRLAAKKRLPRGLFEFVDRGVEDDIAPAHNRSAFTRIKLRHRALKNVDNVDLGCTLFGKRSEFPYAISPTGIPSLCWYNGELELAKAAAKMGIPIALATGSITPMERLAQEAGGRLWFQVVVWNERELTMNQIQRAKAAGYEALIVTVDFGISSNRSHNVRNGFAVPFRFNRRNIPDLMTHPGWCLSVMGKYLRDGGLPRHVNYPEGQQRSIFARMGETKVLHAMRSLNADWEDLKRIRDAWPGILIVKGLQHADDALRSIDCGAQGIVVSNHGGRLMDSAAASLDTLPEIAAAVGNKCEILLDSGVRRGSDIVKALALGAKTVMAGRPTIFGVATAGQAGGEAALKMLKREYMQTLGFIGCHSAAEIGPEVLGPSHD